MVDGGGVIFGNNNIVTVQILCNRNNIVATQSNMIYIGEIWIKYNY